MPGFIDFAAGLGAAHAEPNAKRLFFELRNKLDGMGHIYSLPESMINESFVNKLRWLRNIAAEFGLEE